MKKLIINGDDFGFSEAYNYGILRAFEHGVLTSASIMPNMDAAVHAAALAHMHPKLCISLHMNIVQGKCCADPATIPSIVRPDGTFYRSTEYKNEGKTKPGGGGGHVVPEKEDVKREARAQLERFKQLMGYYPVHMEGHSIGSETITQGLLEVAQEYGIHCMTFGVVPQTGFHEVGFAPDSEYMAFLESTEEKAEALIRLLGKMKAVEHEICALHTHPGYVDATIMDSSTLVLARCRDVQMLCDPRVAEWLRGSGIELIRYDEIRVS